MARLRFPLSAALLTTAVLVDASVPNPPVPVPVGLVETNRLDSAILNATGYRNASSSAPALAKRACYTEILSLTDQLLVGHYYDYNVQGCEVSTVTTATCSATDLASCTPEPYTFVLYTQDNVTTVTNIFATPLETASGSTSGSNKTEAGDVVGRPEAGKSPATAPTMAPTTAPKSDALLTSTISLVSTAATIAVVFALL